MPCGLIIDLLHASPDCTHFSKAKGGKPRSQHIRDLAWVVVRWAEEVRPRLITLENVEEFQAWGPLDAHGQPIKAQAGATFRRH
ncbi:DNA cytosine methyltransferase [Bilophila wadsworthia]|uniref:DNA cytosine methyltransferase n=1 Tax=Bilophila wadsworthia TaxID=35833 RepID=UPI003076B2AC